MLLPNLRYRAHNLKASLIVGGMFICSTLVECLECQDLVEGVFCGYHSLTFLVSGLPLPNVSHACGVR